jgi:hypothetical protein
MDDISTVTQNKKWRSCISKLSEHCSNKAFGYEGDRFCNLCKKVSDRIVDVQVFETPKQKHVTNE